jgi:transcriptional regulator GlxA family with amidase domain
MISIGIVVNDRCQASSVFAVTDLIVAANYALNRFLGESDSLFSYQLIGLKGRVHAYNGSDMGPVAKIQDIARPDIVILPGAFESVLSRSHCQALLGKMSRLFSVLHDWHKEGTTIASVCTGNFILASTPVAAGRPLTCHWASQEVASELFPDESFEAEKLLIDHGDIISAGGAMAASQLMLYLIGRFHSRELALATGKLMLVELNLENQSRFAMFRPKQDHQDVLVGKLQKSIESAFAAGVDVAQFADKEGIGERQLSRRFKRATGETPLSYLQRYRVEQVKIGLESTRDPISNLILDVGYEDPTSFRRLFKRLTGLTMQEYRSRFSSVK